MHQLTSYRSLSDSSSSEGARERAKIRQNKRDFAHESTVTSAERRVHGHVVCTEIPSFFGTCLTCFGRACAYVCQLLLHLVKFQRCGGFSMNLPDTCMQANSPAQPKPGLCDHAEAPSGGWSLFIIDETAESEARGILLKAAPNQRKNLGLYKNAAEQHKRGGQIRRKKKCVR